MSVRFRCTTSDNTHKETGALLEGYLEKLGVLDNKKGQGVVCYGFPIGTREKAINGVGTGGKISSLQLMQAAGVRTVPWFQAGDKIPKDFKFPALARQNHGFGGKDIVPVFQSKEVPWRVAAGFDWFSSYVPLDTEYRAWVFRGEVLDVYEKVMRRPQEYQHVAGRNFRQGFEFEHIDTPKDVAKEVIAALAAIDYDFGAVDCLRGEDGLIYILEVNSAPGALRSKAQPTILKFAERIAAWDKAGHPSAKNAGVTMMRSEFVTRRLIEEGPRFDQMLTSADGGYTDDEDRQYWQGLPQDVIEREAEHDESIFGVEGFMSRFEIHRRERERQL